MNEEELDQEKRTFDEKFKLFGYKASQYTSGLIAFGIAIWWIFYGTVEISTTDITIETRVGLTISTIILALSYCKLLSRGGFKSAKETAKYKKQTSEWSSLIEQNIGDRQAINKFARDEAQANLNSIRKQNLENNELAYKDFFDETGKFIAIGYKKRDDLTKWQKKVIKKLLKLRVQLPNLFGASRSKVFGIHREETQKSFERKTDTSNAIIRIILSFASIGLMFNFIGFSVGSMAYALLQIVLWSASGFTQRLKNYDWVMNTALPQIVEKKLMLMAWDNLDEKSKNDYRGVIHSSPAITEQEVIAPVQPPISTEKEN